MRNGRTLSAWALVALFGGSALGSCGPRQALVCMEPEQGLAQELGQGPAVVPANVVAGPMLGYASMRSATVWIATDRPADVAVRYWPAGAPEQPVVTAAAAVEASEFDTYVVHVEPLEPGMTYDYEVRVDGRWQAAPEGSQLQTAPHWRWATRPPEPPNFRIALGSCVYVNDTPYDRAGSPYGGGYEIFDAIADTDPQLMLWLGDNTYFREPDVGSPANMAYRYAHDRRLPEMQRLLASTAHYATWDDHDYGPNDSNRSFIFGSTARQLFEAYWANPSYGMPDTPGVFTHFAWGDVEFFVTDGRSHRAADSAPDGPDKPMLGDAQLAWLLDALSASYATFKIVVVGTQVLNDHSSYEGYDDYDHERQRLFQGLLDRGIEGVVFLSGDRHHTEVLRTDLPGMYPLYDFTSSPLTSGASPATSELENPQRVPGTLVVSQRNFGTIDVEGAWEDRRLVLRSWDAEGSMLWEHVVEETALELPE